MTAALLLRGFFPTGYLISFRPGESRLISLKMVDPVLALAKAIAFMAKNEESNHQARLE